MTYHLTLTSDQRTWPKNKKIIFLGQWCIKKTQNHLLTTLDYKICKPFLNNKNERKSAVNEISKLVKIFLPKLSNKLNDYHNTSYSVRYWEILIGHWLVRFISTNLNRYYSLKYALDNYDISTITFLSSKNYKLATADTLSYTYATNCEVWNNFLFSKLYHYLSKKKININLIDITESNFCLNNKIYKNNKNFKYQIKKYLFNFISKFSKNNDAIISNSYLSIIDEIKLNFYFNQVPFCFIENDYHFEFNYRRKNLKPFPAKSNKSLFEFLNENIFSSIPLIYLENYSKIQSIINKLNWPQSPKFIFTSNDFDANELFKGWTAKNVEKSIPYFVGQHGNNYGQHLFDGKYFWPERSTPDYFVTWGWDDGFVNNLKGFNFKKQLKKNTKFYENNGLVLVNTCPQFRFDPWDSVEEFRKNLKQQYSFLGNLSKFFSKNTTVRLHHSAREKNNIEYYNERENLIKKFPYLKIDDGTTKLQNLVKKNKLFVFSYDGTGVLEFLVSDIPFIAFWPDKTKNVLEDSKILKLYKTFYEVGIFFKSGKEAALALNKNWNKIDDWWNSKEVIVAKSNFKKYFSSFKSKKAKTLEKLIKSKLVN